MRISNILYLCWFTENGEMFTTEIASKAKSCMFTSILVLDFHSSRAEPRIWPASWNVIFTPWSSGYRLLIAYRPGTASTLHCFLDGIEEEYFASFLTCALRRVLGYVHILEHDRTEVSSGMCTINRTRIPFYEKRQETGMIKYVHERVSRIYFTLFNGEKAIIVRFFSVGPETYLTIKEIGFSIDAENVFWSSHRLRCTDEFKLHKKD